MTAVGYVLLGAALTLALVFLRARAASFAAQRPRDYAGTKPVFNLREHLNGPIRCEGVIYGPMGRVASRFTGDFEGRWDGTRGVMTEHFKYDSGNTQDREWRLELTGDGQVRAEADDLVGTGMGQQSGASLRLCYNIRLPKAAGGHVLSVTDWMYVTPAGVVVNRSQFRKFGIKVAELVATLQKVTP